MTNHDTLFNRDTQVVIEDTPDSGMIKAAVSGVIDPDATLSLALDEVLSVITFAVEKFGEETKEVTIDADAFWIIAAALTRSNDELESLNSNE